MDKNLWNYNVVLRYWITVENFERGKMSAEIAVILQKYKMHSLFSLAPFWSYLSNILCYSGAGSTIQIFWIYLQWTMNLKRICYQSLGSIWLNLWPYCYGINFLTLFTTKFSEHHGPERFFFCSNLFELNFAIKI